jgi:Cof subfamily protein (haloacid dehalogenase superfamily)
MHMVSEPLQLDTPIAGFNGGVFARPDWTVIEQHALSPEAAETALKLILENGLDVWLYTGEDWLVRDPNAPHVAREAWTVKFEATVVSRFTDQHLANAVKIVGVSDDYPRVAKAEKAAQDALGTQASATRSQPYYLDVTNPRANKGAVVHALSRLLSIPTERIATIGDGQNDALMFRESGFSIAMGNASADVQKQAKVVTDSNENEGFAKAIRRFILEQEAS